jgi:hypothetical protein
MYLVKNNRITNTHIKSLFNNSTDILVTIKARNLKWLEKSSKMNEIRMSRKLLACWTQNPRKPGRPQLNIHKSYVEALSSFLPTINPNGDLKQWFPLISSPGWNSTLDKWVTNNGTITQSLNQPIP